MKARDLAYALDFLRNEAMTTPLQLRDEVEDAMCRLDPRSPLWHTLLTVADFLERIG